MATKAPRRSIVLFEDNPEIARDLCDALKPRLGKNLDFHVFPLHEPPATLTGPYEDRLAKALSAEPFGDVVLIVTDRDLSTQKWGGLSEAAVTRAAEKLGLPVACYRQAKTNAEDRLKRIPGNGQIELPRLTEERARQIVTLAKGFIEMERLLGADASATTAPKSKATTKAKSTKKPVAAAPTNDPGTPGTLLARVLGQPEVATHFDLFACGDQRATAEIMKVSAEQGSVLDAGQKRRLVVALGVWLADLVMEYPGLLLNATAAASYLDIHPNDFSKDSVREIFASARYANLPFAEEERPMWWRHLLDETVNASLALTGRDLCASKGLKRIRFCPCSVKPELHAGFYCMATEKPLSDEESSGRVSWFPVGADLARLTDQTHRVLAPWIGS